MTCTTEEYKEKVIKSRDDYKDFEIRGKYVSSNTNIDIFHIVCNSLFNMRSSVFLKGMSCPNCRLTSNRDTTESFKEKVKIKRKDYIDFEITGEYKSAKDKIDIKHLVCGQSFSMKPGNFLNLLHNCPRCRFNSLTHINTKAELQEVINKVSTGYELVDKLPTNFKEDVHLLHNDCGKIYSTRLANFLSTTRPRRCHHCSNNKKLTVNDVRKSIEIEEKKTYKLLSTEYVNVHSKLEILHTVCKRIYSSNYNNFRNGNRCPFCTSYVTSKAVRDIIVFLENKNIYFITEHTYSDLVSDKGVVLRFDFFFSEFNLLLEYDGKQHFVYDDDFIFTKELYLRTKMHDEMKNQYCKDNDIRLERINYKEKHLDLISQLFPDEDYSN